MTTTTKISADFPCYTGLGAACSYRMYEDILDLLAERIGMERARIAFQVIGEDAQKQSHTQMLSAILRAYGDGLANYAVPQEQRGTHSRRVGTRP